MKRLTLALLAGAALVLAGCNQGGTDDNYDTGRGTDSGNSSTNRNAPPAQPDQPSNPNPGAQ